MVKLDLLSENLILILQNIFSNQNLCKLINYDCDVPLAQPDLNQASRESLLKDRVLPNPFTEETGTKDCSQVRVYYSRVDLKGPVVENHQLFFDVIVAKNLWLIKSIDGKYQMRPYEIVKELVNTFNYKSIDTLGKIDFHGFRHLAVNHQFDALQVSAKVTAFSGD